MPKLGDVGWPGAVTRGGGVAGLERHGGKGMELMAGLMCLREKREKAYSK
jgi:hypothetical protein